ncbi:unnamed protein product [Larinioides sclopetarius]|uniref:Parvovirus non-structural protein 1 helicase domain-containing protein n=1 Tax=Larinioides sclopetarius TaxID=280406 RepID=A0AAV2BK70_9ARAC
MGEISYSNIVFGLKHHQKLYDCRTFIEQVRTLHIIISEHDAVTDACDRPGLHYHGIIEHGKHMLMQENEAIVQLRTYCAYCKIQNCDNPQEYVVELAQPPKKTTIIEIANSLNLKTYYSSISVTGIRLELGDFEKEVSKMELTKFIVAIIKTRRTFESAEIWKEVNICYCFIPDELENLIALSLDLVKQEILDQSILVLCGKFIGISESYYTIEESTDIIVEWCRYQSINIEEFTMNLIKCFDRQVPYRNSLYFEGSYESGINNIINSIADACVFVGEIYSETTGYAYLWEICLEKRCIIIRDPIFDERMFEELEKIFRGVGISVPHRQYVLKYLRPTPVIVICGVGDKKNDLYLQRLQISFLESYVNLKPFIKLISDPRRLHPEWLNVLYMNIFRDKIDYASCCENNFGKSMDHDSCELTNEGGLCSDVKFISSTPFAGCS